VLAPPIKVYLTAEDLAGFKERGTVRLKDLCNLRWEDGHGVYTGNDHNVLREGVKIAHWAPCDGMKGEVHMPDGTVRSGIMERIPCEETDKVVQFERFGFSRIESLSPKVLAYFTQ
jgi:glutamyl-tRNA synthetase